MNRYTIKSIASAAPGMRVKLIPNIVDEDVNNEILIVEEAIIAWALVERENGREVIEPVFLDEDNQPMVYTEWEIQEEAANRFADPMYEVLDGDRS